MTHEKQPDGEGRLASTWEMLYKDNEGEGHIETLHKYEFDRNNLEMFEDWKPATPARITPSRRKPIERDHKLILAFGDMQVDFRRMEDNSLVPLHDVGAIEAFQSLARDIRPDELINLGDTVDLSSLSRFNKDSDHFYRTLGPSFQYVHDFYAQLRADNPETKITEVDSNHHKRLTDFVLKQIPDFYGLRQPGTDGKYPIFTYPYLANLEHVGVDWAGGYGAAEYRYADDLSFIHGTLAGKNASVAYRLSKANQDRNIVQGHAHSMEMYYRTNRVGKYLGAMVVGALCRTDGIVPSYWSSIDEQGTPLHYQENWQNSVLATEDYGDGDYRFYQIPIVNGVIRYKGKEYGTE